MSTIKETKINKILCCFLIVATLMLGIVKILWGNEACIQQAERTFLSNLAVCFIEAGVAAVVCFGLGLIPIVGSGLAAACLIATLTFLVTCMALANWNYKLDLKLCENV